MFFARSISAIVLPPARVADAWWWMAPFVPMTLPHTGPFRKARPFTPAARTGHLPVSDETRSVVMRRIGLVVVLAVLSAPRAAPAQVPPAASDMLRRLFATRDFAGQSFGGG